jgi:hypothetical protein
MIPVQRIGHATYEAPEFARPIDCDVRFIGLAPADRAMARAVPPAPDYLHNRPPMPRH